MAKRQRVDEVLDAPENFDIDKSISEVNISSEAVHPEADLEEGTLKGAVDLEEEAGGYVTTDSSSSDTDDGERELVQRQFFHQLLLQVSRLFNTRSQSCCIISGLEI